MSEINIRLITGDGKTKTSYNDALNFFFAHCGWSGVYKNIYQQFSAAALVNQIRINSGMAVLYGRQCSIDPGDYREFNLDPLSGGSIRYYSIYFKVATNLLEPEASLIIDYSTAAYPNIPASDNLFTEPSGQAYLMLYQFRHTASGISNLLFKADLLEPLSGAFESDQRTIKRATFAATSAFADAAAIANHANISEIAYRSITKNVQDNSDNCATTAYVDRMFKTLWSSSSGQYEVNLANVSNYNLYTYLMLWCKGDAGHFWPIMPRQLTNPQINNVYNGRNIAVLTFCPLTVYNGQVINAPIGYLITTDITLILTSNRPDFRIYRIVGVK